MVPKAAPPFRPGIFGASAGGCSVDNGAEETAHASCDKLHWFTWVMREAGSTEGALWRSIAPFTFAISPATTSVVLGKATPCVCFGSSMIVTPLYVSVVPP